MIHLDATHDPNRRSWVAAADGHPEFPIQNLPLGVFSVPDDDRRRFGVAIGDKIFDLAAANEAGLLSGAARDAAEAGASGSLNLVFALESGFRRELRMRVSDLLDAKGADAVRAQGIKDRLLHQAADCRMHLPARIGDYTDFYTGIHHATNVGKVFRPDNPLLPNYKHVPIGYHGRSSSIVPSGTPVRHPSGQLKDAKAELPEFGLSKRLDYELELGIWVGEGNELGQTIPIGEADRHIAGYCLLNDWSARDIQAWEYQPLGPFLAKNFATTISTWVVTPEALAPFRIAQPARPDGDPQPLPYLLDEQDQQHGALALDLDVSLLTQGLRNRGAAPHKLSRSNARHMYWTASQLVAHHASNGCNLQPGDLFGSGTISAPEASGLGSLLEITHAGQEPVTLESGEQRSFLQEGDEIILSAHTPAINGFVPIGFGECRGEIRR